MAETNQFDDAMNHDNPNSAPEEKDQEQTNTYDSEAKQKRNKLFQNPYFCWGLTAVAVIACGVLIYFIVGKISGLKTVLTTIGEMLSPILFGLIIGYLLTPLLNFINYKVLNPIFDKAKLKATPTRDKVARGISVFLTEVLVLAFIYGLFALFISQVVPSVVAIINNFDTYQDNVVGMVNKLLENNATVATFVTNNMEKYSADLEAWIQNNVLTKATELLKTVSLSIISFLSTLWDFILGLIISIYILASKEKFAAQAKKIVYAILTRRKANHFVQNVRFVNKTFTGYVGGKILDSIIIGILCLIGTSIMKTPYAALLSLIIGVTNVIPFFGPIFGAIPTTLLVLIVDPMHPYKALIFVLFILVLQQIDGNLIGPKILGDSTGLDSFWVLFAITVFGALFGVPGMFIGVPVFAVIYAAIRGAVNQSLKKKGISSNTEDYLNLYRIKEDGTIIEYVPESKKPPMKNEWKTGMKPLDNLIDKIRAKIAEKRANKPEKSKKKKK